MKDDDNNDGDVWFTKCYKVTTSNTNKCSLH